MMYRELLVFLWLPLGVVFVGKSCVQELMDEVEPCPNLYAVFGRRGENLNGLRGRREGKRYN